MKKMLLVMAAGVFVAAGTAQAQSETVTSVNVVGYYNVTIPANKSALVTPILENMSGATIKELIGNQLPGGTVYIWNRQPKGYIPANWDEFDEDWVGAGATNILVRGDAFWLIPPMDGMEHTVTFMGEVPESSNLGATSTVYNVSADAVGYPYPVDVEWTTTTLAQSAPLGSLLYVWDMASGAYMPYNKDEFDEAWTTPPGFKIKAGQAFWLIAPGAPDGDWTEEMPYTL